MIQCWGFSIVNVHEHGARFEPADSDRVLVRAKV